MTSNTIKALINDKITELNLEVDNIFIGKHSGNIQVQGLEIDYADNKIFVDDNKSYYNDLTELSEIIIHNLEKNFSNWSNSIDTVSVPEGKQALLSDIHSYIFDNDEDERSMISSANFTNNTNYSNFDQFSKEELETFISAYNI